MRHFLFVFLTLIIALPLGALEIAQGPYSADWTSLQNHKEAPEWFRDAKFGIYFHWGVYSVPAFGNEWYPRHMHVKGKAESRYHTKTWGDPADFGYHDFVPLFTAEKFNADAWADLFVKAGARFAGPVAEHHDGFAMWDSALTPWNTMDKGPKRDISGELVEAIQARDLKYIATFHHARNNQHLVNREGKLHWEGHYPRVEGWPTVSEDPELRMLYGNLPRKAFLELWLGKLVEYIDAYQPDALWFDSWLNEIDESYLMDFAAHYLNRAAEWGKEVFITVKQRDLPIEVAIEDFEKGRTDKLTEEVWLTDDTISLGSWCYTNKLKIKTTENVLHVLIDIVSKNGQLLLNISPMADGTIPENQEKVLLEIGAWLEAYGEAIYATRPFLDFGEGPTRLKKGGHFVKPTLKYSHQDIRYTRKGDTVYAILLGTPKRGDRIMMRAFGKKGFAKDIEVSDVSLLGSDAKVTWDRDRYGLFLTAPQDKLDDLAVVFKLTTHGLASVK